VHAGGTASVNPCPGFALCEAERSIARLLSAGPIPPAANRYRIDGTAFRAIIGLASVIDSITASTSEGPIKVLRVIARLNVGGPARHVVVLDRGLRVRGYDCLLVHGSVGHGEASLEHHAASQEVRARKVAELGPRIRPFDDVRAFGTLLRIAFSEQPDIIHTHTAKAGALGRLAAFIFNVTRGRSRRALVVHTFHGHVLEGYFSPLTNRLIRAAERLLGTVTDRIVTISPAQRRDIVERFRIAQGRKVTTIPLGLDLRQLLRAQPSIDARRRLGLQPADFVVGYVGRLVPVKDLVTLLDAFAAVVPAVPRARLVLAGDGPVREQLVDRARGLGITDRVTFLGWTDQLVDLYAALDVCALTSLNEGTPVAAIEAMAAGIVVVATSVGGIPDLIAHERTGFLVPPRSPGELARTLIRLEREPDRRRDVAAAARLDVERRYSHDRLADDIDQLYRVALSAKRGTTLTKD
jgi:glycosyltransferase involved in cell wall biosynthesis